MTAKIRVVVVDDSALMRQIISRILTDAGFEVVATARNGYEGLEAVRQHAPHVVTLDVEMPEMDGLTMLRRLMKEQPMPVVMLSSLTSQDAPAAIEALAIGAIDVVGKPGGGISLNIGEVADELVRKIRVAARARLPSITRGEITLTRRQEQIPASHRHGSKYSTRRDYEKRLVVIGASTGGPRALTEIVSGLPQDFPCPIVVVQHMPAGFTASLAERLNRLNDHLDIAEAKAGVRPEAGSIWVAPGGWHLLFDRQGRMQLDDGPPHLGVRPAVDLTMESAIEHWGGRIIGVILTGMGMDGAKGARRIKDAGGVVLAQNRETSVVYGMPRVVVEMGIADEVFPIEEIAGRLDELVRSKRWARTR